MTAQQKRPDPLIGTRLGDYTIQALLGRGGMARVYRGLDENLGRAAAVKVLEIHHEEPQDERIVQRFKLEARSIASFEHPNIITIYQYGETDNLFFIAMKLVEGSTLSSMLRQMRKSGQALSPERILQILHDVSAALDYAHARGIIHRDIKPSNILFENDLDAGQRAILTDFGLAMRLSGSGTLGTAFGTPRYIAPEQAVSSQRAVPQSDIYALGVVTFEMLTGRVPFEDESPMSIALHHITSEPPHPRQFNPDIPEEVATVVLRTLEKEPEKRYDTAGEFAAGLEEAYLSAAVELTTLSVLPGTDATGLEEITDSTRNFSETAIPDSPPAKKRSRRRARSKTPTAPSQHSRAAAKAAAEKQAAEAATPKRRRLLPLVIVALVIALVGAGVVLLGGGGGDTMLPLNLGGAVDSGLPEGVTVPLELLYDEHRLALHNLSAEHDAPLAALTLDWGTGAYTGADFNGPIPAGQCSWMRLMSDATRQPPAGCPNPAYHTRQLTSEDAMYWTGDSAPATFDVLIGGEVVQTCETGASRCRFTLE